MDLKAGKERFGQHSGCADVTWINGTGIACVVLVFVFLLFCLLGAGCPLEGLGCVSRCVTSRQRLQDVLDLFSGLASKAEPTGLTMRRHGAPTPIEGVGPPFVLLQGRLYIAFHAFLYQIGK